MRVTRFDLTKTWGPEYARIRYTFTIPKGTRCIPAGRGEYFVDDLSWIPKDQRLLRHDANHYGIRVDATQTEESPNYV